MISDPHEDGGPQTHSERLKVDYDQVMVALHRSAKRFCAPGVRSGVPELAVLLGRNESTLAKQLNPTDYDHATTVHGFLQVIEALQSREAVNEIANLAGCITIPHGRKADEVGAPLDLADAFAAFPPLAEHNLRKTIARLEKRDRFAHDERAEARDALFGMVAYAAHLIHRIRLLITMPDIADLAAKREQIDTDLAIAAARTRLPAAPAPCGQCYNCLELVGEGANFCDAECRDDWQQRERMRVRT